MHIVGCDDGTELRIGECVDGIASVEVDMFGMGFGFGLDERAAKETIVALQRSFSLEVSCYEG